MPKTTPIHVDNLTELQDSELKEGDLYVGEVDISTNPYCYEWWAIVCRTSETGPVFYKIRSWDSTGSSYHPDIPDGSIPAPYVLVKHSK